MYAIGQKFKGVYPPEAAQWCNDNCAMMVPIEGSFEIQTVPQPALLDLQIVKRMEINAGFDAAMTASLTMPSASTPASAFAVYQAIEAWKTEDPEGYSTLLAIHEARRASLLAAVDAATTIAEVQAISVTYAV
ncbi:hypothetical protein [uncultured Desulfovibrio sp.]|uniref:hypothetical protein n=1 Tax=uncultured Desulfovibrio sp. TaxID=167968 RepID=UPI00262E167E|nr:hypothetical protein [uncultured Desulfovibrio sp.]